MAVRGHRDRLIEGGRRQTHHAARHFGGSPKRLLDGGLARRLLVRRRLRHFVGGDHLIVGRRVRVDRLGQPFAKFGQGAASRRQRRPILVGAGSRLRQPGDHHQQRGANRGCQRRRRSAAGRRIRGAEGSQEITKGSIRQRHRRPLETECTETTGSHRETEQRRNERRCGRRLAVPAVRGPKKPRKHKATRSPGLCCAASSAHRARFAGRPHFSPLRLSPLLRSSV